MFYAACAGTFIWGTRAGQILQHALTLDNDIDALTCHINLLKTKGSITQRSAILLLKSGGFVTTQEQRRKQHRDRR